MVNFGILVAEIVSLVWEAKPVEISWGPQHNFAALNRGRNLYSAGRPSRWALAHILVFLALRSLDSSLQHVVSYLAIRIVYVI